MVLLQYMGAVNQLNIAASMMYGSKLQYEFKGNFSNQTALNFKFSKN